jgi:biopolymer transport protein ExbD
MPKIKMPRSSPSLDMTPMVDLAFLLVTFFMLTTQFRAEEAVTVDTPSSVSEKILPDADVMTILIDSKGQVFFNIDGKQHRESAIRKMGEKYKVTFTNEEVKDFSNMQSFGLPMSYMRNFLQKSSNERKLYYNELEKLGKKGIPADSANNELSEWILNSRYANPGYRIAIKGDGASKYPIVQRVITTLQDMNINKFNLITDLETAGE